MDAKYVQDRISFLRTRKGISEYKMSLDLGHSKGYIQNISSGKSYPSVPELLFICDYLGVTPKEFFDEESENPHLARELYDLTKNMPEEDIRILIGTARRLNEKSKS